jgi:hypothetical protein
MKTWRITKYNPSKRDNKNVYLDKDEWTSFSDVGTKVNIETYEKTEQAYVNTIVETMDELELNTLILEELEISIDEINDQNIIRFLSEIKKGKSVNVKEIKELAKLTLREIIWCKLSDKEKLYVHFGFDFYMYIGTNKEDINLYKRNKKTELYIEEIESPYLD